LNALVTSCAFNCTILKRVITKNRLFKKNIFFKILLSKAKRL
jgi:hypothetical protein